MDDEGIMPLVLEDGKIEVSISNTQLAAKGTLLNDRLYEFIEKRNALELQIEKSPWITSAESTATHCPF